MKFLKVGYSRTFPLEQFGNEKPFVEIEIGEGESPMDALNEAKKLVHEFHQQTLAEMEAKATVQVTKPLDSNMAAIEKMNSCKTMDELSEWKLFAENSKMPIVKSTYQNKFKQLLNESK